jgi:hypothetical protein
VTSRREAPRIPRSNLNNLTSRRALYFAAELTGASSSAANASRYRR